MKPVIVTRPALQGAPLAASLTARGIEVLLMPVMEIVPLADTTALRAVLARLESFTLVVFVSPNAITEALAVLEREWPERVPLAVMGRGSRRALAARGISAPRYRVVSAPESAAAPGAPVLFDSESLYRSLDRSLLGRGPVLIVKGNGGREWLAEQLRADGVALETVESYSRRRAPLEAAAADTLRDWITRGRAVQIVVTSADALAHLMHLAAAAAGSESVARDWLLTQRLLVPHPRIAQNATALGFERADLVAPDDGHLVDALE